MHEQMSFASSFFFSGTTLECFSSTLLTDTEHEVKDKSCIYAEWKQNCRSEKNSCLYEDFRKVTEHIFGEKLSRAAALVIPEG